MRKGDLMRVFVFVIALVLLAESAPAEAAEGKCTSVQAKCALEIGGQCDPKTDRWQYGRVMGRWAGGNTQAFMACLHRNKATK